MNAPAVALVPGFLGFDHKGDYTYFADRFVAGLRAALTATGGAGVPVVPTTTQPISSLADRQRHLLADLRKLEDGGDGRVPMGARTWHLIGHSTGGVDAALLLREFALEEARAGSVYSRRPLIDVENGAIAGRVASVISVSAPHYGTALALSPPAEALQGRPSLDALRDFSKAAVDVFRRDSLKSRLGFGEGSIPPPKQLPSFLRGLLLENELARDLRPEVAGALADVAPVRGAHASVVTIAPKPSAHHEDQLFADLYELCADAAPKATKPAPACPAEIRERRVALECQRAHAEIPIDERANDGVVSSMRQVSGTPLALVYGDHADVLGRYRRTSPLDGELIDPGLLTSGAHFSDDAFFELVARMAAHIARAV